jgi:hypothetical protein
MFIQSTAADGLFSRHGTATLGLWRKEGLRSG